MEGGGRSVERERRTSLEWVSPLLFLFRTHYSLWKAPTAFCRPTCGAHSKRCHVSSGCFLTILSRRRHPMVTCRILLSYVIPPSHSKKPRYNIRSSDEYLYDVDAATLVFSPNSTCLYRAGYHSVDSPLTLGSRTRAAYSSGVMLQNEKEKHFDMPFSECERDFSEAATYETACVYGRLFVYKSLTMCSAARRRARVPRGCARARARVPRGCVPFRRAGSGNERERPEWSGNSFRRSGSGGSGGGWRPVNL